MLAVLAEKFSCEVQKRRPDNGFWDSNSPEAPLKVYWLGECGQSGQAQEAGTSCGCACSDLTGVCVLCELEGIARISCLVVNGSRWQGCLRSCKLLSKDRDKC